MRGHAGAITGFTERFPHRPKFSMWRIAVRFVQRDTLSTGMVQQSAYQQLVKSIICMGERKQVSILHRILDQPRCNDNGLVPMNCSMPDPDAPLAPLSSPWRAGGAGAGGAGAGGAGAGGARAGGGGGQAGTKALKAILTCRARTAGPVLPPSQLPGRLQPQTSALRRSEPVERNQMFARKMPSRQQQAAPHQHHTSTNNNNEDNNNNNEDNNNNNEDNNNNNENNNNNNKANRDKITRRREKESRTWQNSPARHQHQPVRIFQHSYSARTFDDSKNQSANSSHKNV
eukprot:768809-Hanusia_phi.AAC.3